MVEGAPLLREYGVIPIEGSNPSLSAKFEMMDSKLNALDNKIESKFTSAKSSNDEMQIKIKH